MWQLIPNSELQKNKWDNCIAKSFNSSVFALSWYLDIVNPKWKGLIYKDYQAVFPVSCSAKLGIQYLFQPYFTNHFDVYTSNSTLQKKLIQEVVEYIKSNYKYIDINLNHPPVKADKLLNHLKVSQYINLSPSYSHISKKYSDNIKRNLKKAEKNNLVIESTLDESKFVTLFKKHTHKKINAYSSKEYKMMKSILSKSLDNNTGKLFVVKNLDKKVVAAAHYLFLGNKIVYFKGFTTEEGKTSGAMHLIMDFIIKSNCNSTKIFDFGGSNVESVARFNKAFGADEYQYCNLRVNNLPKLLQLLKK